MSKPDILIFLSDQHNAMLTGFSGDKIVRTPNMDKLAADGTFFKAAYTPSPLCVPARSAFLSGLLPEKTMCFENGSVLPGDRATFIHSIAAEGYETVLCGRMHFMGEDQRHGFTKRLVGDMTPLIWGRGGDLRKDLGPYVATLANRYAKVVGGGTSPVLEYDRAVIAAALEYLAAPHDKPQCVVVGTYGPHHTYVAPPELFKEYLEKVPEPVANEKNRNFKLNEILAGKVPDLPDDTKHRIKAAYYGMITQLDSQLGEVRSAWEVYLKRQNREGVFVYISDHGDQIGEHGLYNKTTYFEGSAAIPMIFEGFGVQKGRSITGAVSLLDVGPTLCEMIGAEPLPEQDGKSLAAQLAGGPDQTERSVLSEFLDRSASHGLTPSRMIRKGKWKYVAYAGFENEDLMFDISADPHELHNCILEHPKEALELHDEIYKDWDIPGIIKKSQIMFKHMHLLSRWGAAVDVPESERWLIPEKARQLPVI
ncbi:MAG: sulfatase-like hydrolase/transferase [Treponema sp.]|nr:sulfatase-like hydrolase/transferase [Treponema sp.]